MAEPVRMEYDFPVSRGDEKVQILTNILGPGSVHASQQGIGLGFTALPTYHPDRSNITVCAILRHGSQPMNNDGERYIPKGTVVAFVVPD